MADLLSTADLSRADIDALVASARVYRHGQGRRWQDAVVGLMFYEDSLRTRVGFDVAAARLGARSVTVTGKPRSETMWADERPEDAVRSIGELVDVLCLRHPEVNVLAPLVRTPVINCGDGNREHPVQSMVNAFALHELHGAIDGLRVAIVGDLDAMRCAHSLALLLAAHRDVHVRCIAPEGLSLPAEICARLAAADAHVSHATAMDVADVNVVYMAGLPAATRAGVLEQAEQARFRFTAETASQLPGHARVLCPLPRVDEIDPVVDDLPCAAYFAQAALAVWPRMAILDHVLAGRGA